MARSAKVDPTKKRHWVQKRIPGVYRAGSGERRLLRTAREIRQARQIEQTKIREANRQWEAELQKRRSAQST